MKPHTIFGKQFTMTWRTSQEKPFIVIETIKDNTTGTVYTTDTFYDTFDFDVRISLRRIMSGLLSDYTEEIP